jgi:hypothetical protein
MKVEKRKEGRVDERVNGRVSVLKDDFEMSSRATIYILHFCEPQKMAGARVGFV